MPYNELRPSPAIAAYVDSFWLSRGGAEPTTSRILPDGCVDLLFPLNGRILSTCADQSRQLKPGNTYLAGTMTAFADVCLSERASVFGVRFKPFGFSSYFGLPLAGLENGLIEFSDLSTPALFDQPTDAAAMAACLEKVLYRQFQPADLRIQRAVDLILQTGGQVTIDRLVAVSCLSIRQLERKFRQHVGVSAKTLCDVVRIRRSADRLRTDPPDILQIALEQGYYDGSHFTHVFKRYVGQTPAEYRST